MSTTSKKVSNATQAYSTSEVVDVDWSNPDWKYTIEKTHPFSAGTQKLAAFLRRVRRGQANAQTYEDI